ncbi:MAG: hypothetical protein ACKOCQ_04160 [Candidatus Nitrosotenuis sp.]
MAKLAMVVVIALYNNAVLSPDESHKNPKIRLLTKNANIKTATAPGASDIRKIDRTSTICNNANATSGPAIAPN